MKRKLMGIIEVAREVGFVVVGIAFIAAIAALMVLGVWHLFGLIFRPADGALPAEDPAEGVGMRAETVGAVIALTGADADWFAPEEAPVVWDANAQQSTACDSQRTDIGCPDWNADSTLWGWNDHHMEAWEMDLFSRIFYLEFWQPDLTLCEAGCDAILRLWESEYYSTTMYGTLSAVTESGDYAYSTYGYVWDWVYDPDGLAWCRAYCEERFRTGPVWIAPFFRKGCYHDWAMPCYQVGNIYFSTGWGWM